MPRTREAQLDQQLAGLLGRLRLASLAGLLVAGLLATFLLTRSDSYSATSVLSVRPRDVASTNDQVVALLLSRYAAVGQSQQTLSAAAVTAGLSPDSLRNAVAVLNPPATANIRVTATLPTPAAAAAAANTVTSIILEAVARDGLLVAEQVEGAVPPSTPSGAAASLRIGVSVLIGLLVALGTALLAEAVRPRARARRQLRDALPVDVWLPAAPAAGLAAGSNGATATLRSLVVADSGNGKAPCVIAVVSPTPSGAAADWAELLADSLAFRDSPVLLVRAAERLSGPSARPALSEPGLEESMQRAVPLTVPDADADPLVVLAQDSDTSERVLARDLEPYLRTAAAGFSYVVVQAGPLLGGELAPALASHCDVMVLLLERHDRLDRMHEAVALCKALGVPDLVVCGVNFP